VTESPCSVDYRRHLVQRAVADPSSATAELVIGSVGDDAVEPGVKGRAASESVNLPHDHPQRVFHNLFGIGLIPGDADRQTIRTATIRSDKVLGRRRLRETERLDKPTVTIESPRSELLIALPTFGAGARSPCRPPLGYRLSRWCHVHILRTPGPVDERLPTMAGFSSVTGRD
jgi:hypothetical protein